MPDQGRAEVWSVVDLWMLSEHHLSEMAEWAAGRKSYTNMADHDRVTLADVAVMDTAEVQKHAAAAVAYAQMARARING